MVAQLLGLAFLFLPTSLVTSTTHGESSVFVFTYIFLSCGKKKKKEERNGFLYHTGIELFY